jgi:hypothetical protein
LFSRYPIRPTSIAIRIGKIARTGNSGNDVEEVGMVVDRVGVGVVVVVVAVPVVGVASFVVVGESVGVLDGRVAEAAIIVASLQDTFTPALSELLTRRFPPEIFI